MGVLLNAFQLTNWQPVEPYHKYETYVYFMKAVIDGRSLIKIGHSFNPKIRKNALSHKLKTKIEIIGLIPLQGFYNCQKLENLLHKKFKEHKCFGEWFYENNLLNELIKKHQNIELE